MGCLLAKPDAPVLHEYGSGDAVTNQQARILRIERELERCNARLEQMRPGLARQRVQQRAIELETQKRLYEDRRRESIRERRRSQVNPRKSQTEYHPDEHAFKMLQGAPVATMQLRVVRSPQGFGVVLSEIKLGSRTDWNRVTKLVEGDGFLGAQGVLMFDRIVAVDGQPCAERPAAPLLSLGNQSATPPPRARSQGKHPLEQSMALTLERPQLTPAERAELNSVVALDAVEERAAVAIQAAARGLAARSARDADGLTLAERRALQPARDEGEDAWAAAARDDEAAAHVTAAASAGHQGSVAASEREDSLGGFASSVEKLFSERMTNSSLTASQKLTKRKQSLFKGDHAEDMLDARQRPPRRLRGGGGGGGGGDGGGGGGGCGGGGGGGGGSGGGSSGSSCGGVGAELGNSSSSVGGGRGERNGRTGAAMRAEEAGLASLLPSARAEPLLSSSPSSPSLQQSGCEGHGDHEGRPRHWEGEEATEVTDESAYTEVSGSHSAKAKGRRRHAAARAQRWWRGAHCAVASAPATKATAAGAVVDWLAPEAHHHDAALEARDRAAKRAAGREQRRQDMDAAASRAKGARVDDAASLAAQRPVRVVEQSTAWSGLSAEESAEAAATRVQAAVRGRTARFWAEQRLAALSNDGMSLAERRAFSRQLRQQGKLSKQPLSGAPPPPPQPSPPSPPSPPRQLPPPRQPPGACDAAAGGVGIARTAAAASPACVAHRKSSCFNPKAHADAIKRRRKSSNAALASPAAAAAAQSPAPLPEGWHEATDAAGATYYYDAFGQTSWQRPTGPTASPNGQRALAEGAGGTSEDDGLTLAERRARNRQARKQVG